MRGHPAATAPDVGDLTAARGEDELGEAGEHRPVQRLVVKLGPEALEVIGRHGVVGGPGVPHEVRFAHVQEPYPRPGTQAAGATHSGPFGKNF